MFCWLPLSGPTRASQLVCRVCLGKMINGNQILCRENRLGVRTQAFELLQSAL
jgi:hypothetical protein